MLARHPAWGVIALPLLARLYVRKKELVEFPTKNGPGVQGQTTPTEPVAKVTKGTRHNGGPALSN